MTSVELLNTGSELMLGRVLNTHQHWLCRKLADLGLPVSRQTAVPDAGQAILDAVAEALSRADLVITTGGLGPTSDDLTRDLLAGMLGLPLREDPSVLAAIRSFFEARGREMPASVTVQAQVPEGAAVLPNPHGTAPGLAIEVPAGRFRDHPGWLVMLPGPPRELRPMFEDQVVPYLRSHLPRPVPFHCVTLRTCGLGESWVEERLAPLMVGLRSQALEIGYCARTGEVDIRLAASGEDAHARVEEGESKVRGILGNHIYASGDQTLEAVVIEHLSRRGESLALAESCTGGYVCHRLTQVPGASSALWGGWVVYDNRAKETQLGVSTGLLAREGAVSESCARSMAEGALDRAGTRHALALTGIAGPGGGSPEKPVGTLFLGLATRGQPTVVQRRFNPFDRETFKEVASQQALDLLRRRLLEALA